MNKELKDYKDKLHSNCDEGCFYHCTEGGTKEPDCISPADGKPMLPEVYPDDLNECLKIFERIRYESSGFPMVFLYYNYSFRYWSVVFRNPINFNNPEIKEKTPIEAVYKMLDFLKTLKG